MAAPKKPKYATPKIVTQSDGAAVPKATTPAAKPKITKGVSKSK